MASPDPLIHIGYHKTGTTWLQQGLFADPRYGFTRVWPQALMDEAFLGGNPFTFDPDHARSIVQPFIDEAERSGTVPVVSHEPLCGLPTLNGFDSQLIADRVRATFPNGRIMIAIRDQRSMMMSVYKQYVTTSGTLPIGKMWRDYAPEERRRPFPGLEVFEYHHLIDYYQQLFGSDRVLVLPFELLKQDAAGFASEIASFAGTQAPAELPTTKQNVSNPGLLVSALRYSNLVLRAFGLAGPFGGPVTRETVRYFRYRMIDRIAPRVPKTLSRPYDKRLQATVDELADGRFGSSNQITAKLTGLDLASYGYDMDPRA